MRFASFASALTFLFIVSGCKHAGGNQSNSQTASLEANDDAPLPEEPTVCAAPGFGDASEPAFNAPPSEEEGNQMNLTEGGGSGLPISPTSVLLKGAQMLADYLVQHSPSVVEAKSQTSELVRQVPLVSAQLGNFCGRQQFSANDAAVKYLQDAATQLADAHKKLGEYKFNCFAADATVPSVANAPVVRVITRENYRTYWQEIVDLVQGAQINISKANDNPCTPSSEQVKELRACTCSWNDKEGYSGEWQKRSLEFDFNAAPVSGDPTRCAPSALVYSSQGFGRMPPGHEQSGNKGTYSWSGLVCVMGRVNAADRRAATDQTLQELNPGGDKAVCCICELGSGTLKANVIVPREAASCNAYCNDRYSRPISVRQTEGSCP